MKHSSWLNTGHRSTGGFWGSHHAHWSGYDTRGPALSCRTLARAGLSTVLRPAPAGAVLCCAVLCWLLLCVWRRGMNGRRSGVSTTTAVARWQSMQTSGARQVGVGSWHGLQIPHGCCRRPVLLLLLLSGSRLFCRRAHTHASPACRCVVMFPHRSQRVARALGRGL